MEVKLTPHARERMVSRNISGKEVVECIKLGKKGLSYSNPNNNCYISKTSKLRVITNEQEPGKLVIVTVMWAGANR